MSINYLITPTRKDIKAARNYLEWSQKKLGEKCNSTEYTINSLETKRHKPTKELLDKLTEVFADESIKFNPEGGFKVEKDTLQIFSGRNAYEKIQDDIIQTCAKNKKEVLYLGGDDKWSTPEMIKKDKKIYDLKIPIKSLVREDAKCVAWPKATYKKIKEHYLLSDLSIIYDDKVVFTANVTLEPYDCKLFLIKDKQFAEKWRKYFYNLWNKINS